MDRGKERGFITAAEIVPLDEARVLTERERERRELYELGMKVFFGDIERPQSRPAPSTMEVIDEFLAHKRAANLSEATIRSYKDCLMAFARQYPILPTKPDDIEEYLSKHRGENSTARNIYIVLDLLYKFANARLGLPNPMRQVDKPRAKPKAPKPLTTTEAEALLNAIEGDRERGLIYCLFGLGLRLKETRYLRVADIGEDIIRVVRGKERDEPMPLIPEIRDVLLKLTEGKCPKEYIFGGRNGQPLSDSTIQLIIKRLFARAGINGVRASPHTLRHSRGAITAAAGLDTVSSSRLLRHADIMQTNRYSQLNLEQLRAKEERFNPLRILDRRLGKKPDDAQCQPDIGIAPFAKEPYTDAEQDASYDAEVETRDS